MNQTLTLFIVLFTFAFSLSCSDDDENSLRIEQKENDKWVSAQSLSLDVKSTLEFRIKGGNGTYKVVVTDKDENSMYSEIVSADTYEPGVYKVTPYKVGTTRITITDADNNSLKVNLEVKAGIKKIYTGDVGVEIDGISDADKTLLLSEMDNNILFKKHNIIVLAYITTQSGKVTITDSKEKELHTGEFSENLKISGNTYGEMTFSVDNITHTYMISPSGIYPPLRSLGPVLLYFTENIIDQYKEKYPDLKIARIITSVSYPR